MHVYSALNYSYLQIYMDTRYYETDSALNQFFDMDTRYNEMDILHLYDTRQGRQFFLV